MKKMKLAVVFAALVSVFGFSSCLNDGDTSSNWDGGSFVTVSSGYLGNTVLKTDDGLTLMPATASMSYLSDGKGGYHKRGFVYFKLAEGEVFEAGKTEYNVSIVGGGAIPYKDFNMNPDTLKADYVITSLEDVYEGITKVWAKNGYVNVPFTTKTQSSVTPDAFHLYATGVKDDTLYTRFRQTLGGGDNAYQTLYGYISFGLPFSDGRFYQLYGQLAGRDSIVIKVTAKGENDKELVQTVKYRYNER